MLAHKERAMLNTSNGTSPGEFTDFSETVTSSINGERRMAENNPTDAYKQSGNYSRIPAPGIPTYTEAWALIEAARRMASSSDYADLANITDRNKVRDSIRLNWRLWTIFQAEMSVDETSTEIPNQIRTNMLTLCKFVDEHTMDTLKNPDPEQIKTLIEINRNIAAGLLESLKQLDPESEAADATNEAGDSEPVVTNISTSV